MISFLLAGMSSCYDGGPTEYKDINSYSTWKKFLGSFMTLDHTDWLWSLLSPTYSLKEKNILYKDAFITEQQSQQGVWFREKNINKLQLNHINFSCLQVP